MFILLGLSITLTSCRRRETTPISSIDSTPTQTTPLEDSTPEVVPVASVSVSATKNVIGATEKLPLTVTVLPEDATDKTVTLTSSDTDYVKIDENNQIEGVRVSGDEEITITATANNGVKGEFKIKVVDAYTSFSADIASKLQKAQQIEQEKVTSTKYEYIDGTYYSKDKLSGTPIKSEATIYNGNKSTQKLWSSSSSQNYSVITRQIGTDNHLYTSGEKYDATGKDLGADTSWSSDFEISDTPDNVRTIDKATADKNTQLTLFKGENPLNGRYYGIADTALRFLFEDTKKFNNDDAKGNVEYTVNENSYIVTTSWTDATSNGKYSSKYFDESLQLDFTADGALTGVTFSEKGYKDNNGSKGDLHNEEKFTASLTYGERTDAPADFFDYNKLFVTKFTAYFTKQYSYTEQTEYYVGESAELKFKDSDGDEKIDPIAIKSIEAPEGTVTQDKYNPKRITFSKAAENIKVTVASTKKDIEHVITLTSKEKTLESIKLPNFYSTGYLPSSLLVGETRTVTVTSTPSGTSPDIEVEVKQDTDIGATATVLSDKKSFTLTASKPGKATITIKDKRLTDPNKAIQKEVTFYGTDDVSLATKLVNGVYPNNGYGSYKDVSFKLTDGKANEGTFAITFIGTGISPKFTGNWVIKNGEISLVGKATSDNASYSITSLSYDKTNKGKLIFGFNSEDYEDPTSLEVFEE